MTDTARYADVLLPATTFLEGYDLARGYGPISLRLGKPVDRAGRRGALERRRVRRAARPPGPAAKTATRRASSRRCSTCWRSCPQPIGDELREHGAATPPFGGRPDPVRRRVAADAGPQGRSVSRSTSTPRRRPACTATSPTPRTAEFPLALISPASERTDHLDARRAAAARGAPADAPDDAAARGLTDGDAVRIFNALGEVRCNVQVGAWIRPGTVVAAEGAVAQAHRQRLHGQRARAGHADRSRRRRVLQRRARPGGERSGQRAAKRRCVPASSSTVIITEEEDQIEAAALDAAELYALRAACRLRRPIPCSRRKSANLILEDELGRLLGAEPLAHPEEQLLAHLLADRQARPAPPSPCAWISNSSSSSALPIERARPDVR